MEMKKGDGLCHPPFCKKGGEYGAAAENDRDL
jgi:hypothetical protein